MTRGLGLASLLLLAACSSATLPYTPVQQPSGAKLSAAYQLLAERLRIEVDTDGRRLEEAKILKADGAEVRAQSIESAPRAARGGFPVSIGVGGSTYGGGVGVGTGVNVGVPVGGGSEPGNLFVYFPRDQAGPAPWRVSVKVAGVEPVVIVVGGAQPQ